MTIALALWLDNYSIYLYITWAPAGIFVGGSEPQKGPPQDEKGPPQKKKFVLAPFLGGSEKCSPEKKFKSGAPYYILDASQHERI